MKFEDLIKPEYFWDISIPEVIKGKISRRLIVERILSFGTMEEIQFLTGYFGKDSIVEEICKINYLDPKTLNFVSKVFEIPKTSFKCYMRKQSIPQYWNL